MTIFSSRPRQVRPALWDRDSVVDLFALSLEIDDNVRDRDCESFARLLDDASLEPVRTSLGMRRDDDERLCLAPKRIDHADPEEDYPPSCGSDSAAQVTHANSPAPAPGHRLESGRQIGGLAGRRRVVACGKRLGAGQRPAASRCGCAGPSGQSFRARQGRGPVGVGANPSDSSIKLEPRDLCAAQFTHDDRAPAFELARGARWMRWPTARVWITMRRGRFKLSEIAFSCAGALLLVGREARMPAYLLVPGPR